MHLARPLPAYLISRFHGWRATTYQDNKAWYRRLAENGQHPRAMVISCCDSRVHVTSIFGADEGEFFIHRNIANLVPPYNPDGEYHGTSAAVEYAVTSLGVAHIVVLGHSHCGGVKGCHDMCSGHAPALEEKSSFVGRWMDILRPGFERVRATAAADPLRALEKEAVLVSLENLMTFPFVRSAVEDDRLTLHGLWTDTGEGGLEQYDPARGGFAPVWPTPPFCTAASSQRRERHYVQRQPTGEPVMQDILTLAGANLLTPMILCFALGLAAALARSELSVPEAAAKALSIYLLFAIGFKGGVSVADHGLDGSLIAALIAGVILSFALPFAAFALLKALTRMSVTDAAAVAAHYGSISIVTFVTATSVLQSQGIAAEGYMVAVAAAMEAPAIISALFIVSRAGGRAEGMDAELWREILLNGSIVLLIGSFAIGLITGAEGMARIESFIVSPFQGVLCLFLLDMGLVAGRGLRGARGVLTAGTLAFGILMPILGAASGLAAALLLGLSAGGTALMMTLAASASYIAVPAAMRVALPEANPSIYLTLSLGITFPFNLTLGIPAYVAVATALTGG